MKLAQKMCVPCAGGVPPLGKEKIKSLLQELNGWKVVKTHHLEREFLFKNFKEALAFVNAIGKIAEKQGHHPDIFLAWGKVKVAIWTHKVDGLTESDFILAAKINTLPVVR